jgi:hypothetical protein
MVVVLGVRAAGMFGVAAHERSGPVTVVEALPRENGNSLHVPPERAGGWRELDRPGGNGAEDGSGSASRGLGGGVGVGENPWPALVSSVCSMSSDSAKVTTIADFAAYHRERLDRAARLDAMGVKYMFDTFGSDSGKCNALAALAPFLGDDRWSSLVCVVCSMGSDSGKVTAINTFIQANADSLVRGSLDAGGLRYMLDSLGSDSGKRQATVALIPYLGS